MKKKVIIPAVLTLFIALTACSNDNKDNPELLFPEFESTVTENTAAPPSSDLTEITEAAVLTEILPSEIPEYQRVHFPEYGLTLSLPEHWQFRAEPPENGGGRQLERLLLRLECEKEGIIAEVGVGEHEEGFENYTEEVYREVLSPFENINLTEFRSGITVAGAPAVYAAVGVEEGEPYVKHQYLVNGEDYCFTLVFYDFADNTAAIEKIIETTELEK